MTFALEAWHIVTGIGGLLGFISAGILLYDRLLRHRPVAWIKTARDNVTLMPEQVPPKLCIRNAAPFHLLVERFVVTPPYFDIMPNFFPVKEGMSLVTYGTDTPILLEPNEERDMAIVFKRQPDSQTERINITIHWRAASAGLLNLPVRVRTSLADIKLRQRAAMNVVPRSSL